jgi:chain length determinant protein EpsF
MNLRQILLILRARYKLALVVLLATVAVILMLNAFLPGAYTATTSLVVDVRSRDPVAALFMPGSVATQIEIINSRRVALNAVRILRLDEDAALRQEWQEVTDGATTLENWLADSLLRALNVRAGRDGNIIHIDFKSRDAAFAAAAANAFAQAFIDATIELKIEPAKQYSRWFENQERLLRENLEKAQTTLSRFQQEKGIVARVETLDTETSRLAALTAQLSVIQEQNAESRSKQRQKGAGTLPEVMQNSVIVGLRGDIARMEAKLQEASGNLGTNHPQYRRMESELAELKTRLDAETRYVASGFVVSGSVGKDKEAEIRAAIEAQKKRMLQLQGDRDQLAVLQRDVDAARQAHDAVTTRLNQASLESQANQANVSVLTPAIQPLAPTFPKPLRVVLLLAIAIGAACGVGAACAIEMLDRRIRSVEDLGEMLQVPVLGVIGDGQAHRQLGHRQPLALR